MINRTIIRDEIPCGDELDIFLKKLLSEDTYPKKKRTLFDSFKFAWEGLAFVFKTQRNMKIHASAAAVVFGLSFFLKMSYVDTAILIFCTFFVVVCEMINTAIEVSMDFLCGNKFDISIKRIKDVVAGAVLLASANAVIVGTVIVIKNIG